jgi:hypothetical protein
MKRIFVAVLAATLVAGLVPASAAGAHGGGGGGGMRAGGFRGLGLRAPEPRLRVPNMQSRIPAPLPAPAQAPVINGPLSPNGMPAMGNGL